MRTTVTRRCRTVIPAELRRRYNISSGSQIEWIDTGAGLKVIPVQRDPVAALRGIGREENLVEKLLAERRRDRASELAKGYEANATLDRELAEDWGRLGEAGWD